MSSPRFPASAILLDAMVCPLDTFDALFARITEERGIADGYFLQAHPDETMLLFLVNGFPYAAGRLAGEARTAATIEEFFGAYARHPESPVSFCVADRRLLLGLMVLFHHTPALRLTADRLRLEELLRKLAAHPRDAILALRAGDEWAISILAKGRPLANYLPSSGGTDAREGTPAAGLLAYAESGPLGEVGVEVYEETRVTPAADAARVAPAARRHLSEVFLVPAAPEAETPPLELEAPLRPVPEGVGPEPISAAPEAAAPVAETAPGTQPPPPAVGPAPEVLLYLGDRQLASFSLAAGELTIGRNPANDIVIENAGVSRRHAVIKMAGERVSVEDLGSANGTLVNGKRIAAQELRDRDEITIVKHRLVLHVPKEGEAIKTEAPEISGQRTMFIDAAAVAQAVGGKPGGRTESATPVLRPRLILPDLKKFALEGGEVTLGSGSECSIQLSGMFVARIHARIVPHKEGQYKLVHVAGLSGTRVNGEKVVEHILKHGDEIEIGKSKLLFRLER